MAKGDQSNSANGTGVPPKTDQYSVMHRIMDSLGSPNTSIAPSAVPSMPQQQSFVPNSGTQMGGRFNTNPVGSPVSMGGNQMDNNQNFSGYGQDVIARDSMAPSAIPQMGGRFHTLGASLPQMNGDTTLGGSMAPSDPQEMMRRSMTGNRTYGQLNQLVRLLKSYLN